VLVEGEVCDWGSKGHVAVADGNLMRRAAAG